jgi:pyrimidine operon attenuation protein/uracil phosphoribosyltransferase
MASPPTVPAAEIHAALARLAAAIRQRHAGEDRLLLLGIANGGVPVARRIAAELARAAATKHGPPGPAISAGALDISFHRDDIGRHPIPKEFTPTLLPGDVNGATVILVDDVLFTGRTVKAALDELFDHGRPARVELAVLVDRDGRRLPVAADFAGLTLAAGEHKKVVVALDNDHPERDRIRIV